MSLHIVWREGVAQVHGTVDGKRVRKSLRTNDPDIAEQLKKKAEAKARNVPCVRAEHTFIYVMSDGDMIKVGLSSNPDKRMRTIVGHSGRQIAVIYSREVPTRLSREIEKRAHLALGKSRVVGEWFNCDERTALKAVWRSLLETPSENIASVTQLAHTPLFKNREQTKTL